MRTVMINLSILIVFMAFIAFVGCQNTSGDKESEKEKGKVIVPDEKWEKTDGEGEEKEVDRGTVGNRERPTRDDQADGSGTEAETGVITKEMLEGTMELSMTVNGVAHPIEMPIEMHDGEQAEVIFKITATGSELAEFEITNAAPVSIPKKGKLEGMEAEIKYPFTFIQKTWGDGGIQVVVINRVGTVKTWTIPVVPAPMPGMSSR